MTMCRPGMAGRNFCDFSTCFHKACNWTFHMLSKFATELRFVLFLDWLSLLRGDVLISGRLETVLVWPSAPVSSDISPRRISISDLSFSASLLILMNCVRFW